MSRDFRRAFAGGELTSEFFGQLTDAKYQTGLALCRNFRILPHGPAQNRAGFEFVREVKNSQKKTRLMPFTYSTTQTMALEVGEGYFRFHTQGASLLAGTPAAWSSLTAYTLGSLVSQGGVSYYCVLANTNQVPPNATYWYALPAIGVYEVPNSYLATDLFGIKNVQSSDVFSMVHTLYAPAELRRLGSTTWTWTPISFATTITAPANVSGVATLGGTPGTPTLHRYAVTSVAPNNIDESLISASALGTVTGAISAITKANPGVITTTAPHGLTIGQPVIVQSVLGMTQINGTYNVGTVPTSSTLTLVDAVTGSAIDTSAFSAYTSGGAVALLGVMNNLFDTGAFNTINWFAAVGALRYNVYKFSNGLWAYIGQAVGTTFKDNNITPDISKTPPEANNPFPGAGDYPGAVTYFDQRRCFAGTINKPQNMWLTRSGTESNMTYSIPTRDADSIAFRVVAREANTVRHLVPLANLLALTSSAEWRITSNNTDSLTPTSFAVKPQSYVGANDAQPVIVNNNVVYASARGGHVRELAYQYQAGGYLTGDLSLRAPHLFDQLDIVDIAFSKAPYPIIWMVSSNGKLLGLTYVPEQQIGAWHQHDTDGLFESICVVAEGSEDVLYAIVNRNIGGVLKRYVERMRPRVWATPADAFHVDSGATFNVGLGNSVSTISGVDWLEGKTINILADGAVHRQLVVTGGSFTLDTPATNKVQFGLPITSDLETLPLAVQMEALGQGKQKNVNKVFLRVKDSSGILAGPSLTQLVAPKLRTTESYGSPIALQSREVEVVTKAAWTDSAQVFVRQSDPLPLTIIDMTIDYTLGG